MNRFYRLSLILESGRYYSPRALREQARAGVLEKQGNGIFPERRMSALESRHGRERAASAVSEARDGEANEAKGICRFPAYGASFDDRYLKLITKKGLPP